ncbi:hypothetical protein [Lacisediminimonas profundi]|uniref:hypothetical protein n=1 Tax=Lacisediminimonas profundi TaxID=2603856 RepID=UPI00124B3BC4|nr:hypothetical protein [Lacisediminimonas profundi]
MLTSSQARLFPVILSALLSACGGGSSGGIDTTIANASSGNAAVGNGGNPAGGSGDTLANLTMSCADGSGWQCSGGSILRVDNGIALTRSGVQAYGKSTNDLEPVVVETGRAIGLMPASGGTAEVRIRKDGNSAVSTPALLLSNLGISWDGKTDRPIIIETFMTSQGRVELGNGGTLSFRALPPATDLSYWDVGIKGASGTKINYANNSYFPRSDPSRCPADLIPCPTIESTGLRITQGDWRSGGIEPDLLVGGRLHEDGDTYAGNGPTDANGNVTYITTSTGPGVPFPGSKGYRTLDNWSYRYGNFASWVTQDTVDIIEWGGTYEINRGRRGVLAYGDATDPAAVPATGSATYTGLAYGWYSPNGTDDPVVFRAAATITANFATRQVTVALSNAVTYDASLAPVPTAVSVITTLGAAGQASANYMTGAGANAVLSGGLSARFFGPVAAGGSGTGPAELAGVFSMNNPATGQVSLGGFIGARQ